MIRDSCGNVLLRTVVASTSAVAMIKKIWSRKREGGRERERDLYACVCVNYEKKVKGKKKSFWVWVKQLEDLWMRKK